MKCLMSLKKLNSSKHRREKIEVNLQFSIVHGGYIRYCSTNIIEKIQKKYGDTSCINFENEDTISIKVKAFSDQTFSKMLSRFKKKFDITDSSMEGDILFTRDCFPIDLNSTPKEFFLRSDETLLVFGAPPPRPNIAIRVSFHDEVCEMILLVVEERTRFSEVLRKLREAVHQNLLCLEHNSIIIRGGKLLLEQ